MVYLSKRKSSSSIVRNDFHKLPSYISHITSLGISCVLHSLNKSNAWPSDNVTKMINNTLIAEYYRTENCSSRCRSNFLQKTCIT